LNQQLEIRLFPGFFLTFESAFLNDYQVRIELLIGLTIATPKQPEKKMVR